MNFLHRRRGTIQLTFAGASGSNRPKTFPVETQKESDLHDGNPSDVMVISENDISFNRKGAKPLENVCLDITHKFLIS
jgi:hypothetical protein